MKTIKTTHPYPLEYDFENQSKEVKELFKVIVKACLDSELSYTEMNKALYLADKGLYDEAISRRRSLNQK